MREGGEDGEGGGRGTGFAWQEGDFSPCSAPSLALHTQPCCALQLRAGSVPPEDAQPGAGASAGWGWGWHSALGPAGSHTG